MRKIISLVVLLFAMVLLTACAEEESVVTWTGLEDQTITRGDLINLLDGITATDSKDGVLTVTVKDDDGFSTHLAGGYAVIFEASNKDGVVEEKTKNFSVVVGHNVANGNFELGAINWTLDTPGGNASVAYAAAGATVTITNAGNSWWGIQLIQQNVVFKANETYKVTLVASSPQGRSVSVGFEDPNNGFAMLNPGFMPKTLGTTDTTYEMYYTSLENYSNVKVVVYLGHQLDQDEVGSTPHTVRIKSISISKVTKVNIGFAGFEEQTVISGAFDINPLTGVSALNGATNVTSTMTVLGELPENVKVPSSYYLTYVVVLSNGSVGFATRRVNIALPRDFEYQPINGKFTNGLTGWTQDVIQTQGTGEATFTNNGDGTVNVLVTNPSNAGWHIQLQQSGITFKQGESYVVRLVAKADIERKVIVEVVNPDGGFAQIAPTLEGAVIGTDWVTYEIHFTADQDYTNAKLGLLLGNVDGMQPSNVTFTVDELTVYKYSPFNQEFETAIEPWNLDNINAIIVDGSIVVTFDSSRTAGNDPWNNQLYQTSGSELVLGHTYQIEVRLKASIARDIRVWVEDPNNGYFGIATGENTFLSLEADTWTVLTYTFTVDQARVTTNAKYVIMLGAAGVSGDHTVTVDYFRVTDITNTIDQD